MSTAKAAHVDELAPIVEELLANRSALEAASNEAGRAYEAAKRVWPSAVVEAAWQSVCGQYKAKKALLNPQQAVPNAAGWRTLAEMVRLARNATAHFTALAALPWQEKVALDEQRKRDTAAALQAQQMARGMAHSPGYHFDPAIAVRQLAASGVSLSVVGDDLRVSPAGQLTAHQKSQLLSHKAALVEFLQTAETV